MSEKIIINCPECNSKFHIISGYTEDILDCPECGSAFENPNFSKVEASDYGDEILHDDDTVVISRRGLGMIPDLEDVKIR